MWLAQCWLIVGATLDFSWFCVGLWLAQRWVMVGTILGDGHGWVIVCTVLGDGWHTVGFWLAHCWFMVGKMLLYGWRFNVGSTCIQRAKLRWPNQICCCWANIKPTVGFWLANG